MQKKFILYYLLDEKRIPFYVGITTNFKQRMKRHVFECYNKTAGLRFFNSPKSRKLRKVLEITKLSIFDIVDIVERDIPESKIDFYEKYHIKNLKYFLKLKNCTEGGRNSIFYDANIQKRAAKSRVGRKLSEETKQKISLSRTGMKFSNEHKIKLSLKRKQRIIKKETLEKMRNSMKGKNTSKYKLIDPQGNIFIINGLIEFCKKNNLSHSNISKVAKGLRKHHKGWRAEKID